jgi:hypothetical protein
MHKKILASSLALILVTAAGTASARPLRIDFDDTVFDTNGSSWPNDTFDDNVDVSNDGVSDGSLGTYFELAFGGTTFTSFCLEEDGVVTLSAQAGCGGANDLVISVLGNDFLSDPSKPATAGGGILNGGGGGSVSFSTGGLIDRQGTGTPPTFDEAEAQRAIRFLWNGLPLESDPDGIGYGFQAIFFERAGGFDLELNYGFNGTDPFPGVQSITFGGASLFAGTAPILTATDYFFSFVGDTFTVGGTPPTSVPEPETFTLLLGGFATMALSALRRRRGAVSKSA